jgi:uncharacterized FAD-dependent dehydrogenase
MIRVRNIKIPIELDNEEYLKKKLAKKLNTNISNINNMLIHKRSLDARIKNNILYVYEIDIEINNEEKYLYLQDVIKTPNENYNFQITGTKKLINRPIIVGSGPAGLFCTYILVQNGYKPILIERGEDIDSRIKSVEEFWQTGKLNEESNVQFGCGGAGTFSDGKLNTLVKDPLNRHREVFKIFIQNGADENILYDFNPHIGTDKLRDIVKNICHKIILMGGEIKFNSKLTDIIIKENKIQEIEINNNYKIKTDILVLAIGHSARDTFNLLLTKKIEMESKPFAIGLRVQHNQDMINKSTYGEKYKLLPPASYKLTYKASNGRGVYSFCMCPGGYVVNSSSENNKLSINGMSNYLRESLNSNSAIIVTVDSKDFGNKPLDGLKFQEELESKAYLLGNGNIPIQLYGDFKKNKPSNKFGTIKPIFKGNYTFANLNELLPNYISSSFIEGMNHFDKIIKGFGNDDVILSGIESRTSSPIKIKRNEQGVCNIEGIYPCGEGPGYAGGITSAAMDGLKIAEDIASEYFE